MRKLLRCLWAGVLACCMLAACAVGVRGAGMPSAQSILASEKKAYGITGGSLMQGAFLANRGTAAVDWVVFAAARAGANEDYAAYRAALEDYVRNRYQTTDELGKNVTEWHRVSLVLLACGGNPQKVGSVNLIADGTYQRGRTIPLGRQGINAYIWALITLDSVGYAVPAGAADTRDSILKGILSRQLTGGGFAGAGSAADADLTAMAITALAPYYHANTAYTFTNSKIKQTVTATVRTAVDRALAALSGIQAGDGGFRSGGQPSSESAAQVIVALCSMGIDPREDMRFIKNGKSPVDALLAFRTADGGFRSRQGDSSSNRLANGQAMLALNALERLDAGQRAPFDLRPAFSQAQTQKLATLRERIRNAKNAGAAELAAIRQAYAALPDGEKRYIYNYTSLPDSAAAPPHSAAAGAQEPGAASAYSSAPPQTELTESAAVQTEPSIGGGTASPVPGETAGRTPVGAIATVVLLCAAAGGSALVIVHLRKKQKLE